MAVALVTSALLMTVITPHLALRYYILPVLLLPYLLARLGCLPNGTTPRWVRRLSAATLLLVIGCQGFYVATDYFYAHLSTGGKIHIFPLGKYVMESSNGFVRTDRLYEQLRARDVAHVVADNLIRWPLEFYDMKRGHIWSTALPGQADWAVPEDGATAVIYYNGPTPTAGLGIEDMSGAESIDMGGQRFALEPGIDPNFLVYLHRP